MLSDRSSDHPPTPPRRFTLSDLVPDSVEVMAVAELANYNQHPIVSVWERSSGALNLRIGSLRRGSCCDFHGNSAISGCCALPCLHDNCLHGSVTVQDELGGLVGVAPLTAIGWQELRGVHVAEHYWM